MSTLLLHVAGSRLYNLTLFRPHLYIYDDHLVYKKRHILTHDDFSFNYSHIAQVDLIRYIFYFGHLEIYSTGSRNIKVKWIPKKEAERAKKIIDEKVYQAHKQDQAPQEKEEKFINNFELSLQRLKELLNTGKINIREYEGKRKDLLKKHY